VVRLRNFRDLIGSAGCLTVSNIVAGLLSVGYLGVATRALSLADLGRFAAIVALVTVSEKFFGFHTWKAVVHFSSIPVGQNRPKRGNNVLVWGGILDFSSAILASFLLFVGLNFLSPAFIDFGQDPLAQVVVLTPLFSVFHSTALGIIRLRRHLLAESVSTIGGSVVTLLLFVGLSSAGSDQLGTFAVSWAIGLVTSRAVLLTVAFVSLRRNGNVIDKTRPDTTFELPTSSLVRFFAYSKLDSSILALRNADVLLVSYVLGPDTTGLYKVARQISSVVARASSPLGEAFLPVLSRLRHQAGVVGPRELAIASALFLGLAMTLVWLVFLAAGSVIVELIFGPGLEQAVAPASLALAAMVVFAVAQPLAPMLVSRGKVATASIIGFWTTVGYFVIAVFASVWFGIHGAVASLIIYHLVRALMLLHAVRRS
jgi:O-antigen/teichoic acid export membrane protein